MEVIISFCLGKWLWPVANNNNNNNNNNDDDDDDDNINNNNNNNNNNNDNSRFLWRIYRILNVLTMVNKVQIIGA